MTCKHVTNVKHFRLSNSLRKKHTSHDGKMDKIEADRRALISAATKVFGDGKWNHTVISQHLDFIEAIDTRDTCCARCTTFVKVQLNNGNFHEDVGFYAARESNQDLSIRNARIGSSVDALKRTLLSFGDIIEKELQQSQKQRSWEQIDTVQMDVAQFTDKPMFEASNVSIDKSNTATQLQTDLLDDSLEAVFITSFSKDMPSQHKPIYDLTTESTSIMNDGKTMADSSSSVLIKTIKKEPDLASIDIFCTSQQKSKPALSRNDVLRTERKRKQMQKQMEFKKRMMEKQELTSASDGKPNPRH